MAENIRIELTSAGKQQLEEKLEYLKTVRRKEVQEEIKTAKGFGDLSENAEYDEAKKAQAELEEEIAGIEYKLKYAKVIDTSNRRSDEVAAGVKVKLYDVEFDEEVEYLLVGPAEADLSNNKLSYDSPVGKGILGHRKGETVKVTTPGGEAEFKILDVIA